MKKTFWLVVVSVLLAQVAVRAQATAVRVEAHYSKVPAVYLADVVEKRNATGLQMPVMTVKSGARAEVRVVKEYKVTLMTGKTTERHSGAKLEVLPTIKGNKIEVVGRSSLCGVEVWDRDAVLAPLNFVSQESFFQGKVQSGDEVVVKLAGRGLLYLRLTLVDAQGNVVVPPKKKA